jgi:hypothetical protein
VEEAVEVGAVGEAVEAVGEVEALLQIVIVMMRLTTGLINRHHHQEEEREVLVVQQYGHPQDETQRQRQRQRQHQRQLLKHLQCGMGVMQATFMTVHNLPHEVRRHQGNALKPKPRREVLAHHRLLKRQPDKCKNLLELRKHMKCLGNERLFGSTVGIRLPLWTNL